MPSIISELTVMAYSELTSTFFPSSFRPSTNSGTFITSVITPTGRFGKKTFMTCATPVSPPMDIWPGTQHQQKPNAYSAQPKVMIPYCFTLSHMRIPPPPYRVV